MSDNKVLEQEYKRGGIEIVDFHLGKRYGENVFINIISIGIFIIGIYYIFFIFPDQASNTANNTILPIILLFILFVGFLKFLAALYVLAAIVLFVVLGFLFYTGGLTIFENPKVKEIVIGILAFESIFVLALIPAIKAYFTNKKVIMKDGFLFIPASDVEMNWFDFIILKPIWGIFYKKKIPLEDIVEIRIDGYGNKKKDIYPVTVIDKKASNRLIFRNAGSGDANAILNINMLNFPTKQKRRGYGKKTKDRFTGVLPYRKPRCRTAKRV